MINLILVQGSKEWLEHRKKYFNASDAAAMLGICKYKTREKLLRSYVSDEEVPNQNQFIFDKGHRAEALARPIIESIIGDDLYPIVGVEGKLSASFDGINITETICFEHKLWNKTLPEQVENGIVPDAYMPQLQQQLMVSGADKVIFVVSDGTREKMVMTEVKPCEKWFKRIENGWNKFEAELNSIVESTNRLNEAAPFMLSVLRWIKSNDQEVLSKVSLKKLDDAIAMAETK